MYETRLSKPDFPKRFIIFVPFKTSPTKQKPGNYSTLELYCNVHKITDQVPLPSLKIPLISSQTGDAFDDN